VARDIAQQVWLHLYEKHCANELAPVELPGLALRQAEFFLKDQRRRAARADVSDDLDGRESVACALEPRLIAREQVRRVQAAVDACPPAQRRIFWAVYAQPDRPHAEVAQELGISVQHLRQTLFEVRQRVRIAMEDGYV
jgi:RNA polymerase sigma factor (sigma-70 family)